MSEFSFVVGYIRLMCWHRFIQKVVGYSMDQSWETTCLWYDDVTTFIRVAYLAVASHHAQIA